MEGGRNENITEGRGNYHRSVPKLQSHLGVATGEGEQIMPYSIKRTVLISLAVTLLSLVLLSSSLSNLQLEAGTPFPGGGDSNNTAQPITNSPPMSAYFNPFLRGIFSLIFIILLIYVPVRLISLIKLKQIFGLILTIIVLVTLVIILPRTMPGKPTVLQDESSNIIIPPLFYYPTSPLGKPPEELIWFVLYVFFLGASFLIIKVVKQQMGSAQVEEQLLQEAQNAVNALKAGENLKNVIIRCYLQMTHVLQKEQGMERSNNMTVREFENWLESKGVPCVPVRHLTHLFEKVRYGKLQLSENDEKTGVESLNEIIKYCRREKDLSK